MIETDSFFNDGFGWQCRECHRELGPQTYDENELPRFYMEGEKETLEISLTVGALAKWADPARSTLTCPRCGISEKIDKH